MKIIDINGEERECEKVSPDPKYPGFMKVDFVSKHRKGHKYKEWYPIADFVKYNPALSHLAQKAPKVVEEDLGVVTIATKTTLTDKEKNWKTDEYKNYPIWISRGKGEGQIRIVIKNSKNKLTIDKPWKEVPNNTSQYVLSQNVNNPQARGNTLEGVRIKLKDPKDN